MRRSTRTRVDSVGWLVGGHQNLPTGGHEPLPTGGHAIAERSLAAIDASLPASPPSINASNSLGVDARGSATRTNSRSTSRASARLLPTTLGRISPVLEVAIGEARGL